MLAKIAQLTAVLALVLASTVTAAPLPKGTWPASKGLVQKSAPIIVKKGEVFDGKMFTYERSNIKCTGGKESGSKTAVFLVEAGGTLKNVIIGKNQAEGVHCDNHDCRIENVWWDDVCEDALSIKGGSASSVSTVVGGGARYADDKVIQHNGKGHVIIDGFYAKDFGKLFRSIATVNKNFGDSATLHNIHIKSSKSKVVVCAWSQGTTDRSEPKKLGDGPLPGLCNYSPSNIHLTK